MQTSSQCPTTLQASARLGFQQPLVIMVIYTYDWMCAKELVCLTQALAEQQQPQHCVHQLHASTPAAGVFTSLYQCMQQPVTAACINAWVAFAKASTC